MLNINIFNKFLPLVEYLTCSLKTQVSMIHVLSVNYRFLLVGAVKDQENKCVTQKSAVEIKQEITSKAINLTNYPWFFNIP